MREAKATVYFSDDRGAFVASSAVDSFLVLEVGGSRKKGTGTKIRRWLAVRDFVVAWSQSPFSLPAEQRGLAPRHDVGWRFVTLWWLGASPLFPFRRGGRLSIDKFLSGTPLGLPNHALGTVPIDLENDINLRVFPLPR